MIHANATHKDDILDSLSYMQGLIEGLDYGVETMHSEMLIGRLQEIKGNIFAKLTDKDSLE